MTKKRKKKKSRIYIIWLMNLCLITAVVAFFVWYESVPDVSPEKVLKTYMAHISNREYEQMYEMIDAGISGNISQEDFVKRNSAIYEGIDVDNMKVHITSYDKEQKEICYETSIGHHFSWRYTFALIAVFNVAVFLAIFCWVPTLYDRASTQIGRAHV